MINPHKYVSRGFVATAEAETAAVVVAATAVETAATTSVVEKKYNSNSKHTTRINILPCVMCAWESEFGLNILCHFIFHSLAK